MWVIEDPAVIYISVLLIFSSRRFIVSGLTFRSLIHFELTFVYGVRRTKNTYHFKMSCVTNFSYFRNEYLEKATL